MIKQDAYILIAAGSFIFHISFLNGTTVAQETDNEDKCTNSYENVSTLLNHGSLSDLMCELYQNLILITAQPLHVSCFPDILNLTNFL